jgi:hypothetical protein
MYHQLKIQQFYVLPTQRICVLCGSQNKHRLFPYTALIDLFLWDGFKPLKPSGYYTYHQVWHSQFYVLPTECICFVWIWEKKRLYSLYSIKCLVFITETECLLRGTDWVFIHNSGFFNKWLKLHTSYVTEIKHPNSFTPAELAKILTRNGA